MIKEQLTPLESQKLLTGQATDTAMRTCDSGSIFRLAKNASVNCQTSKIKCAPRGFTLIEMTVSLGLFTIIMFIATSAFLSIVNTDRKARSVRIVADNLNIALEDMSRRIKTGSTYNCGGGAGTNNCPSPGLSSFAFTEQNEVTRTVYTLIGNAIMRGTERITSPEITITNLKFIVSGSAVGSADNKQPMVVIVVDGSLGSGAASTTFKIQTTVTQRAYDN